MSTSVISPPPGFQLEQNDPVAVKPPAGFQLEGNHSPNQGTVDPRSQPQRIAGTSQIKPPVGLELEKRPVPVQVQQPITPPQPKAQPVRTRPPVSRVKTTQTKQTGSTVHDLTVQNRPQHSSLNELEAGERIRQIRTPQQQQSDAVFDSILHPENYYPSFIESMAPGMRKAMGNQVAAAIRAGLEPPMPSESTAASRKLSGITTLAPPAGPDLKHPAGVSYWTNPRTGQRVVLDAVPEQQAIPILDSWVGLEPMATGLTRMRENNPSKMYFTWGPKGRPTLHVEYIPGQEATPEEIARHNRQQMLGMAETLQGGMQVASPLMVGTAATAPLKAALWMGAGYGAEETGGALLHGHVSPEAEDLARTLLVMAPGVFGAVGGLKTGGVRSRVVPLTPETFETFIKPNLRPGYVTDFAEFQLRNPNVTHMTVVQSGGRVGVSALGTEQQMRPLAVTAGGTSLFGGKLRGGVAGTPEAYGGGIGIGRTNLTVRIPRSRTTTGTTPQEAAQTIIRYDQRVGNLPAPKPPAPASPPGPPHLAPENIQQLSAAIGRLSELQRGDAMAQAHRLMTAWMLDRTGQSFLGPDHKLHIVNNPAEAQKLALKFINDQVDIHDKRLAEEQPAPQISTEVQSGSIPPSRQFSQPKLSDSEPQHITPATESLRPPSPEDFARIDPNFKLDPVNASLMRYEVIRREGNIPPVLVLNPVAYQVVTKAYGRPVDGVNLPMDLAERIIARIRQQSATESSRLIRKKLNSLARKMEEVASKDDGLSLVRDAGRTKAEFRAIQEELFHSVLQRRPGKGSIAAGVPHEAFAHDANIQKMQPRLAEEGIKDPISLVAEAMQDVWGNEAPELTMEEQSALAEKYWEQGASKNGNAMLFLASQLWQHLQQLARQRYNFNNTAINEVMNEKAFAALQRVIARTVGPPDPGVQETDQSPPQRVLLQHRGREEMQGGSGESEEPGTRTGGIERPQSRYSIGSEAIHGRNETAQQGVITRRAGTSNQGVQGTDQPTDKGILLQHRRPQEAGRNLGEGEEPGTQSGAGPGEVDRLFAPGQSVFLPNGRRATIQFISPLMNVAVVRLPDGQIRTVKLPDLQGTQPRPVPAMGRNMTVDSPAVRRVQSQARPVPGQVPEVKVKREPPQVQTALALPPAPVSAEEVGRIGQTDLRTGRQVLQPSNSLVQNERLAGEAAPYLTTKLSEAAAAIPGARFDRLRPQKGLQRLEEKVADGKPPSTIGDNLAAQIVANTVAAKDQLIARLGQQFPVISVDDKFLEPREKAGYPSTNVQVHMPNGGTAEVQIVTPEIQAITDQTHRLYTLGRNFPEGSPERARYWNQAAAMHQQALGKFLARNAQPSTVTFVPGEKVVLRSGQTAKIVGPSRDLRRVVVRTPKGMRTVKHGDLTFARPGRTGPPQQPPLQLGFRDASRMQWSLAQPGRDLPAYLALDETANRVLNHVSGGERSGMNAPAFYAQRWVERIRRLAVQQRSGFARQKLENFARAVASAIHPTRGLNIAEKTADLPEHVDTVSEELFHSVTRSESSPDDAAAGVPYEELHDHPLLRSMRPRIERETGKKDDVTIVMEAMNDVAFGQAPELTLPEAERFARDMWQATLKYYGLDVLQRMRNIYEYLNDLRTDTGVTLDAERESYVDKAKRALEEIINRGGNPEDSTGGDAGSRKRQREKNPGARGGA